MLLLLEMLLLRVLELHKDVWEVLLLLVGSVEIGEWRESRLFLTIVVTLGPVCCAQGHGLKLRQERVLTLYDKSLLLWPPVSRRPIIA